MANWFTRYLRMSTKASQFGTMLVRAGNGQAAWPERNGEQLAREGYIRNIISYRCIRMVADSAASIPLCLFRGGRELSTHEILDLLTQPNPVTDGTALWESWFSWYQINGNAYLEQVRGLGDKPIELWNLPSTRMRVVPGETGLPQAYDYKYGSNSRRVEVDFLKGNVPILHMRHFHPLDDWYGLSPIDPAAWSIDTHSNAGAYNTSLLKNSAVPSGAIVVKEDKEGNSNLEAADRERLKQELELKFAGAMNAGRPMVLEGGLDWKTFAQTLHEMQFSETKREAAREICFAHGVPPMLLGIPGDNTYSNYKEANTAFWRGTVIPLAQRSARCVSPWLTRPWGNTYSLVPNLDNLDALAEARQQQWERVATAPMLKVNEKREATGYEKIPDGDVVLVPNKTTTLERVIEGVTDESGKTHTGKPAPKGGE